MPTADSRRAHSRHAPPWCPLVGTLAPLSPRGAASAGGTARPLGSAAAPDGPRWISPAAPTFTRADLEAGAARRPGVGAAGGGLTPANVSRTRGGPAASCTGHGRPSKWLAPAPRPAPALPSMAICLHLPSLGLAATCPPARPPAHPLSSPPGSSAAPDSLGLAGSGQCRGDRRQKGRAGASETPGAVGRAALEGGTGPH